MIGRVAHAHYQNTPMEGEPLCKKVENILDALFTIPGVKRIDVSKEKESDSESDADY